MSVKLCIVAISLITHHLHASEIDCNGDCDCSQSPDGETCTLNCIGTDVCKDSALTCGANNPCIVNCNGISSCGGNSKIFGASATHLVVNCEGTDACKGNTIVNCASHSCSIACGSSTSCDGTNINVGDTKSFQCSGSCTKLSGSVTTPFAAPTPQPTVAPSRATTSSPTTKSPTLNPTRRPTGVPTLYPSRRPTLDPSRSPTTKSPSRHPTVAPTLKPSKSPLVAPSASPSEIPTVSPTRLPSLSPTIKPTTAGVRAHAPTEKLIQSETTTTRKPSTPPVASSNEANANAASSAHSSSLYYVLIISGVLIIIGAMICCAGIFVHYTSKQKRLVDEIQVEVDKRRVSRNPLQRVASNNSSATTQSVSTVASPVSAPTTDGVRKEELTVPQNAPQPTTSIYFENVDAIPVEPEQENVDSIVNHVTPNMLMQYAVIPPPPPLSPPVGTQFQSPRRATKKTANHSDAESTSEELSSCSTSTGDSSSSSSSHADEGNDNELKQSDPEYLNSAYYAYAQAEAVCGVGPMPYIPRHSNAAGNVLQSPMETTNVTKLWTQHYPTTNGNHHGAYYYYQQQQQQQQQPVVYPQAAIQSPPVTTDYGLTPTPNTRPYVVEHEHRFSATTFDSLPPENNGIKIINETNATDKQTQQQWREQEHVVNHANMNISK